MPHSLSSLAKRIEKLEEMISTKSQEFEDHNFRIDSIGWIVKNLSGIQYLENPEGDVWELINQKDISLNGEQLFTWNAAMRETKKAGKRMPTDAEFSGVLKTKDDMPNLVFAGNRNTDGSFAYQSTFAFFWSSTESASNALYRYLNSGQTGVSRSANSQAYGFSVRCSKD